MTDTVMVRVRRETRDRLRSLSEREGITAIECLDRLVQEHEDRQMLAWFENVDADTATVIGAEVAEWDDALTDGLDPSDSFSAWR